MSYTQTNWIDGVTPVNASNLNKLEQGIADLHAAKENGELRGDSGTTVKDYGANGDGSTNDTTAFQNALSENRVVKVPGGTYKLSGTLVIKENCCLELSQDAILQFANTSGNCIEMRSSAVLRGNHGMISVPYAFTGNVISMDTTKDGTNHNSIPPYLAAGSHMAKRQRFVYDINILKPDSNGICKSTDGKCNGTAIYMSAEGTASFRWMWAITMSGIRIAGGFSYGIRAYNIDKAGDYEDNAWNHDMRIEAVIENCEIGVALENCNGAHLAVTVQPHATESGVKYAKHGVYLKDARFIDMIGSRVWDWNENGTLWTAGGQYQHIALVDNCRGLLLDDFLCHESSADIRDLIYTNNTANFDTMTVLQEAGGKGVHVQEDYIKYFTDVLATATDGKGNVFEGKGYVKSGYNINSDGSMAANQYYGCTGFIPVKPGDTVYVHGIVLGAGDGSSNFSLYNASFAKVANINSANSQFQAGNNYYYHYTALENGFKVVVAPNNDPVGTAYLRFSYLATMVKDTPMVAINEEIKYLQANFLADDIKVKSENVLGGTVANVKTIAGGAEITITDKSGTTKATVYNGKDGHTPVAGVDYYTDAEKAEFEAIIVDEMAQRAQIEPEFANSIEECTDTSKLYVLPDGYIYAYMTKLGALFTNRLTQAVDTDGAPYNGGLGYKPNTTLWSDGHEGELAGAVALGFIPFNYASGDRTIRVCGYTKNLASNEFVHIYDSSFNRMDFRLRPSELISSYGENGGTFELEDAFDGNVYTYTLDADKLISSAGYYGGQLKKAAYIRFSISAAKLDSVVVTVNEEIAFGTSTHWVNTGHAFVPADCEDRIIPLEEKAENHESRIRTLEMYGSDSTSDADIPAYIKAEADAVIEKVINKQGNRSFTMVGISDFHYGGIGDNKDNLIRACKAISYIQGRIHVDAVATLGDNVPFGTGDSDSMTRAHRYFKEINEILKMTEGEGIVMFRTPGNHDRLGASNTPFMPDNAIYSYISGYNRQCILGDVPGGWGYRDFESYKLRVIVLNTAECEGQGRFSDYSGYHVSIKQYRWLVDTLDMSDKPNASDWQILILSHHRPDDWQEYITESSWGKNGYIMPNILNAYITGGSFTGTLSDGSGVSCDFTGKNQARLIGCIHGHHHDYIYRKLYLGESTISDTCNIMAIGTPTSSFGTSGTQNNDNDGNYYDNVKDTAQETAFCVYSIDLDNRVIHAVHYGAGIDRTINY